MSHCCRAVTLFICTIGHFSITLQFRSNMIKLFHQRYRSIWRAGTRPLPQMSIKVVIPRFQARLCRALDMLPKNLEHSTACRASHASLKSTQVVRQQRPLPRLRCFPCPAESSSWCKYWDFCRPLFIYTVALNYICFYILSLIPSPWVFRLLSAFT